MYVIENCDNTSVIFTLVEIIKQIQNDSNSGLLINKLLKTTQYIQSIINNIQLDKIILQMTYLLLISKKYLIIKKRIIKAILWL